MNFPFYTALESHHVSSEPTGIATNKVPSEQAAVPLKGYTHAQIKASIDGKFKSPQGETPPEHEGARTGKDLTSSYSGFRKVT